MPEQAVSQLPSDLIGPIIGFGIVSVRCALWDFLCFLPCSGASPATCFSTCVSRIHRAGECGALLQSDSSHMLSHLLPLQPGSSQPLLRRGSLIFWHCFSHTMTNPFSSAKKGEATSTFLPAILCRRWNHCGSVTT